MHLDPFFDLVNTRGIVKKTILVKDELYIVFTTAEQIMFYYPPLDKVLIGYNSALITPYSRFIGKLGGVEVFNFPLDDIESPADDMPIIWGIVAIVAIVAAAVVAMGSKADAGIDSKSEKTQSQMEL